MTLILDGKEIEFILEIEIAIKAVEEAFREMGEGKAGASRALSKNPYLFGALSPSRRFESAPNISTQ